MGKKMKILGIARLVCCVAAVVIQILPLGAVLRFGITAQDGTLSFRFRHYALRVCNVQLYDMCGTYCDSVSAVSFTDGNKKPPSDAGYGAVGYCACNVADTVHIRRIQHLYNNRIGAACGGCCIVRSNAFSS